MGRSGREGSPNRSRDRKGALLALPIDLTLPYGHGSDWSTPYARILSIGRHLRRSPTSVSHTRRSVSEWHTPPKEVNCTNGAGPVVKAARIHRHGGPDVLVYEDVPEPAIRPDQVLVRVRACALNHLDLFVRAGIPGMKFAMPHVLGSDIAGEIVAVGDLCQRVRPGWRVLLSPGLSCRQCQPCLAGYDTQCRRYSVFGYGHDGGNTELLAAPEYSVIQIPDTLSLDRKSTR